MRSTRRCVFPPELFRSAAALASAAATAAFCFGGLFGGGVAALSGLHGRLAGLLRRLHRRGQLAGKLLDLLFGFDGSFGQCFAATVRDFGLRAEIESKTGPAALSCRLPVSASPSFLSGAIVTAVAFTPVGRAGNGECQTFFEIATTRQL